MQVDPTPMNVGDGGSVSREIGAPHKASSSMVGNPPQTLPPEFRGDVSLSRQNKNTPTADCKTIKARLDTSNYNHRPELSSPHQPKNASALGSSDKRADKLPEAAKIKADGTTIFSTPQWSSGVDALKPCHSNMTSSKKTQSLPAGFQCSAMFKPVAFLPSTNFSSSPLCKIALPPALGQIAALREATAGQFHKDRQPQSSGLLRSCPYQYSVGRTPTAEKKPGSSKHKSNHSLSKNGKSVGHQSLASVVASPAMALPLQHPSLSSAAPTHYTISPTAAICCGSALASITSQSRLLNHVEKARSSLKTTLSSAAEDPTGCSVEPRDVPLDLSAKSKRPKCISEPAVSLQEPHLEPQNSKRTQYPLLPNTHRNGSHQKPLQNHQVPEPKAAWGKGSSEDAIKNIPGTYVGVASPILASTLCSKDGTGTFADDFQSFAKQEVISIVDQGEHLSSGGKKASSVVKSSQHVKTSKNCPSKGALSAALSNSSSNAHIHQKPATFSTSTVIPTWQQTSTLSHRKMIHGSPKNQSNTVFPGAPQHSPSSPNDDRWERRKSPPSIFTSALKQPAVETPTLSSEAHSQLSPVTSRKPEVLHTGGHQTPSKRSPNFESKYSTYWPVDKWRGVASQGDLTKKEKVNSAESSDGNPDHVGLQSKPAGHSHLFRGSEKKLESRLAQVLEEEMVKTESGPLDRAHREKCEGTLASVLIGHCSSGEGGKKLERKTNGTKDELPAKLKVAAAAIQQKKASPKRTLKEKSSAESPKKSVGKKKKKNKQDTENSPTKIPSSKKQKNLGPPVVDPSPAARRPSSEEAVAKEKGKDKVEKPVQKKTVSDSSSSTPLPVPVNTDTAAPPGAQDKDASFPRLRRGRRRLDDARLDLWGFATPSPPPPPPRPPPASASPPPTPFLTPRRPRGRPRSNNPDRGRQSNNRETEAPAPKKRRRCWSKKDQSEDRLTEVEQQPEKPEKEPEDPDCESPSDSNTDPCLSPEPPPLRSSVTRSGSVRCQDGQVSTDSHQKPSGKRKFKSKHLYDIEEQKTKSKRGSLGKRGAPLPLDDGPESPPPAPVPKSSPPSPCKKGSSGRRSGSASPTKRLVPPEVRRLIVNKNAGETLLQRAARLGYQDVVEYCLEKDVREVNRRDNAGYTALHEASSRGWTQIVQILLKHGADVNCSAQDGTRPLHDAVASDNLPIVWLLLNHGADPTLATYSGHTPVKLAQSMGMKTFLAEYFSDLEGRTEHDSTLKWDFYSSSLFETEQEPCWDFLLSEENQDLQQNHSDWDKDCLVFEFSSEPLLPCFHIQVSLSQGFCNWFLLTDVLKRLKMSARIFRARYPHLEVVNVSRSELWRQMSVSQVSSASAPPATARRKTKRKKKRKKKEEEEEEEMEEEMEGSDEEEAEETEEGLVDLVRCVPELQRLLGSSVHVLEEDEDDQDQEEEEEKKQTARPRGR